MELTTRLRWYAFLAGRLPLGSIRLIIEFSLTSDLAEAAMAGLSGLAPGAHHRAGLSCPKVVRELSELTNSDNPLPTRRQPPIKPQKQAHADSSHR